MTVESAHLASLNLIFLKNLSDIKECLLPLAVQAHVLACCVGSATAWCHPLVTGVVGEPGGPGVSGRAGHRGKLLYLFPPEISLPLWWAKQTLRSSLSDFNKGISSYKFIQSQGGEKLTALPFLSVFTFRSHLLQVHFKRPISSSSAWPRTAKVPSAGLGRRLLPWQSG